MLNQLKFVEEQYVDFDKSYQQIYRSGLDSLNKEVLTSLEEALMPKPGTHCRVNETIAAMEELEKDINVAAKNLKNKDMKPVKVLLIIFWGENEVIFVTLHDSLYKKCCPLILCCHNNAQPYTAYSEMKFKCLKHTPYISHFH